MYRSSIRTKAGKLRRGASGLVIFALLASAASCSTPPLKSPGTPNETTGSLNGVNVDMSSLVPGTPYTLRTSSGGDFFDFARQLGIKVIRIVDSREQVTGQEYTKAEYRNVYNQAAASGIKIIQLTSGSAREPWKTQEQLLLQTYGLAKLPALWMIDIANEPTVNSPTILSELKAAASYAHQVAPGIPVTIGGWKFQPPTGQLIWQRPSDLSYIIGIVNVVSPHLYGYTQALKSGKSPQLWTRSFLSQVRHYAQGKPIFLEEWGASNGVAPASGAGEVQGTLETQATIYQGVLGEVDAERHLGLLGSTSWIFSPRYPFPGVTGSGNTGWAIVLDNGSKVLPAANAFKDHLN